MATRIYGVSRGENTITEGVGSATAADNVEVTVDLAVSLTKAEFVQSLEKIIQYVIKGNWTPA